MVKRGETNGEIKTLLKNLRSNHWTEKEIIQCKKEVEPFVSKFSPYLPEELKDELDMNHDLNYTIMFQVVPKK